MKVKKLLIKYVRDNVSKITYENDKLTIRLIDVDDEINIDMSKVENSKSNCVIL